MDNTGEGAENDVVILSQQIVIGGPQPKTKGKERKIVRELGPNYRNMFGYFGAKTFLMLSYY